jgi:8-oxo-dGTP pyrophosphatase MutT (NUDIX family)
VTRSRRLRRRPAKTADDGVRATATTSAQRRGGARLSNGITLEPDVDRALALRASVSAVIFDRRDRVLLQQRSDGGQWGLPGGSVEIGESVAQAIVREVREETGLDVVPRRLIGVYSEPSLQVVRYPDGNVWHSVNVCFECAVRGGSLTTCDETLALAYVPAGRLPAAILPNHVVRIRDARRRRPAAYVR